MQDADIRKAKLAAVALGVEDVDRLEMLLVGLLEPDEVTLSLPSDLDRTGPVGLRDREGVLLAVLHPDGRIEGVEPPHRHDFREHRERPGEGPWVAFAARRPIHRQDLEALLVAAEAKNARLLVIGDAAGEAYFGRIRCLQAALAQCPPGRAQLYLAPLSAAGAPKMDARVARRLGAVAFIPDGVAVDGWRDLEVLRPLAPSMSEAEVLRQVERGEPLPDGFTFEEVEAELRRHHPPRWERGFTVLFTGLSGSGKSTLAKALLARLLELGPRRVTLLDGDIARTHLSKGLGFSKADRDTNVRRIGFVAAEVTKHGGAAICAPIAPYAATRRAVRNMVEMTGGFVLVHVATPLEECERRDRKGLYAKARRGEILEFTGISDPYEEPSDAEVVMDTTDLTPDEGAERVIAFLKRERYLE